MGALLRERKNFVERLSRKPPIEALEGRRARRYCVGRDHGTPSMPLFLMNYPVIDPVMVNLGPLPVRWYALGYIVSLVARLADRRAGWCEATRSGAASRDRRPQSLDDLLVYVAFGAVLGGRTGYVLFYNLALLPRESAGDPGGVEGRHVVPRRRSRARRSAPGCSRGAKNPLPQRRRSLLRRGADRPVPRAHRQFHQAGAVGPPERRSWAMVFPGAGPEPRHPSQLYEAGLEGLALGLIVALAVRAGALRSARLDLGLFIGLWACAHFLRILPRAGPATRLPVRRRDHGHAAVGAAGPARRCSVVSPCAAPAAANHWRRSGP